MNCGRDNFPIFFRRGMLPKGDHSLRGPGDNKRRPDEYVRIQDFFVGQNMRLCNNDFFIYDADPSTRKYFEEHMGCPLEQKLDVRLPERELPRPPTPPYTGYGSWDDSMGSVVNLVPKQPKKDFIKLVENDGKILRFTAKYTHPKPEDVERRFVHITVSAARIFTTPKRGYPSIAFYNSQKFWAIKVRETATESRR